MTAPLPIAASPVRLLRSNDDQADTEFSSRDWSAVLRALEARPGAILDAHGQMTDELLAQVARVGSLSALRLGNSPITDVGLQQLQHVPTLKHLDLSQTAITDAGLEVLRLLPALESLSLSMTGVTDAGMTHLHECSALQRVNLMRTRTGDGAIAALDGKSSLTHFWSGDHMTDAGLAMLHALPVFRLWHGDEPELTLFSYDSGPNLLSLRGSFTDDGMRQLSALRGLWGLNLDDSALQLSSRAMLPLLFLPRLARLAVRPKDDWMPHIAAMPALRFLGAQDTATGDDGFEALSASQSLEYIWGRRCHNLRTRGFQALARMPKLRGLSVSCLNVGDIGVATLPDFPALRELMPMDVPDAGYRHIGRCVNLEALLLMYCRDTTDAATEQITGLPQLRRYFNSFTMITDRTPLLLSGMDSLEEITFDGCHNLTDAGVAALARLPRLKELHVAGNGLTPKVTSMFPSGVTVHYSS